jgi:thioesterase domain-containing protein
MYKPSGNAKKIDILIKRHVTPVNGQLAEWQGFSREPVEFIEREGDHAEMINGTCVERFEQRLSKVLAARGI